jgi:5-deoxy-5-amino-3-dehydroquinate synthase
VVTSASLRDQPWFDFDQELNATVLEVPDGESAKTLGTLELLLEELAAMAMSRDDVIVSVGGGAITDLAGFAAATFLRGVGVVHVPTTLLGQVDAAIGGKTAVNLASGKNLVGAFHQPLGVFCDFEVLDTLPERERLCGLGEVAKCWLLENRTAAELEHATLEELVFMSVNLKARIVSADELEGSQRALLNYGHTLGHAIELLALERDVDELRHGEAVAIGLAFAVRLAHALGRVDVSDIVNHDEVLQTLGLGQSLPQGMQIADIVSAMGHDKKAHHDLTFVLPGPDGFETVRDIDRAMVEKVLENFRGGQ